MKRTDGSFTVESTFIMIAVVFVMASIMWLAMDLHNRVVATSKIRTNIEKNFSKVMTEQTTKKSFSDKSGDEQESKTFVRAVDLLYAKKIIDEVEK